MSESSDSLTDNKPRQRRIRSVGHFAYLEFIPLGIVQLRRHRGSDMNTSCSRAEGIWRRSVFSVSKLPARDGNAEKSPDIAT